MKRARQAAVVAAALILATALLQLALAAGAPWGDHAYGGSATTTDGVLPPGFRAASALAAIVLVLAAGVVLGRAQVIRPPLVGARFLSWGTWSIVGFLVLNSVGNLASDSPFERWIMAPTTLVLIALCGFIALRAPAARETSDETRQHPPPQPIRKA